jgi:hypothetical protein
MPWPVFREGDDAKVLDELIFSIGERLAVAAAIVVAQHGTYAVRAGEVLS